MASPRVQIGVAGWAYDDWAGIVYPRPRPRGFHPLPHLARFLDLVELNSSFYAPPRPEHAARWVALLEGHPAFGFLAKLHRAFTHEAWPSDDVAAAATFEAGLAPLADAERLMGLLAQFSVAFRASEASFARLARIRDLFGIAPLTVELRHRSWFTDEALDRLRALDVGLAHIDLPAARDHPPARHPSLSETAWFRFHGRNARHWFDRNAGRDERYDHRYDRDELDELRARIQDEAMRAERVFVVLNNHFRGQAVANALELLDAFRDEAPLAPAPLVEAYPDLARRVRVAGQQRLF